MKGYVTPNQFQRDVAKFNKAETPEDRLKLASRIADRCLASAKDGEQPSDKIRELWGTKGAEWFTRALEA